MITPRVYDVRIEFPAEWFSGEVGIGERVGLVRGEMERRLEGVLSQVGAAGGTALILVGTVQLIVQAEEAAWRGGLAAQLDACPILHRIDGGPFPVPDTVDG